MPYKPGESGNPKGRKPGSTPGAKLRQAILDDMPDIIATLVAQAKGGDVAASKILIDKIIPGLKNQALPVQIAPGSNLASTGNNVLNAALNGDVAPDTSALLLNAVANQSRIEEFTLLEERITALEGGSNG